MALVGQSTSLPIRRGNRDQDWSRLCNSVFDQYQISNDLFDTNSNDDRLATHAPGNFLPDATDLLSQEAFNTAAPFWESAEIETKQPQAKEMAGFWSDTVKRLEKNAAEDEARTQFCMEPDHEFPGASGLSQSDTNWSTALEAPWDGIRKPVSNFTSLAKNSSSPESLAIQHPTSRAFQTGPHEPGLLDPDNTWMTSSGTWNNDVISSPASSMDMSQLHRSSASPTFSPQFNPRHAHLSNLSVAGTQSRRLAPRSVPVGNTPSACHDFSHSLPLEHSPMTDFSFCESPLPQSWSPSIMSGSTTVSTPLQAYGLDESADILGISNNSNLCLSQPATPQYNNSPYLQPPRALAPMLTRSTSTRSSTRPALLSSQRSSSSSSTSRRPRRSKSNISSRSNNRSRELSPGSTTSSGQTAEEGGFVNFTPQHGKEILGGVAPSGSSKTKARREREAAEKRRRLNQAAVRAVMEAGGDLSALSQAGIMD